MAKSTKNLTFEKALEKLQDLVGKLEKGELTLEQSLQSFEDGMQLSTFCEKKLHEAKGKVEKVMSDFSDNEKIAEISEEELKKV